MSRLGSLYIDHGEPEGELTGCTCEVGDWAADYIEKLEAKIASMLQEPNQPKGTGEYTLTIKVGVYRDSSGYETAVYYHPSGFYFAVDTKNITGHWEPIYTPDKE